MHKGRILEHTQASTFFAKPRTAEAQRFLDGALLIDDDGGTDEGFDT
jgi:ABC-type methionine transport system ATPase subunit